MLQLFRLCLQDGARLWFEDFGVQSRDVCYDAVKEAFLAHYKHVEDASDVWHQLEACFQKEDECVDVYAWRFSQLWNSEVKMDSLFVKREPMPQISSPIVVMGHCVDAIKDVHDVHVDEIEAHVPIEEEKDMANALAANHVEEMSIVLNVVEYEHEESVAKNVVCDEVSFGLCALDVDNRLTSKTMDVFGAVLGHVLLDFIARSMVALILYDGLCYICGLQQVYDPCMVNNKQGTDCIVDDDDWGFDDPAVEMNKEMQPFVDAALERFWVMREQQSHEVVMNSSEAIHMYGREGGSDVCVGFDYGLAYIEIERNLWDMFTMEHEAMESSLKETKAFNLGFHHLCEDMKACDLVRDAGKRSSKLLKMWLVRDALADDAAIQNRKAWVCIGSRGGRYWEEWPGGNEELEGGELPGEERVARGLDKGVLSLRSCHEEVGATI
ncbi:hypothetical protein L7F22_046381 [Adiantum nelumboides]|nr:hypothetical protein [Adiantum nelumboides]